MKRTFLIIVLLNLGLLNFPVQAQTTNLIRSGEIRLDSLSASVDPARAEYGKLKDKAGALAVQISLLKAKSPLSAGENRDLERLMQQSQTLEQEALDRGKIIEKLNNDKYIQLQALVDAVQSAIDSILDAADGDSSDNQHLQTVRKLMDKKRLWENQLVRSRNNPVRSYAVQLDDRDSPRTIRLKGDLLMDRRDGLIEEGCETATQIVKLQKEMELRIRLNELNQDIALFDERDERIRNLSEATYGSNALTVEDASNDLKYRSDADQLQFTPYHSILDDFLSSTFPRSSADMKLWITRLENHRKKISVRADSLEQQAQIFYKKAESPPHK